MSIEAALASTPRDYSVRVLIAASEAAIRQRLPASVAVLEPAAEAGEGWLRVSLEASRLDWVAGALALLDAERNGVVLSSITHRETARLYCKQVVDGRGEHLLSPEEDEAIRRALAGERGSAVLED